MKHLIVFSTVLLLVGCTDGLGNKSQGEDPSVPIAGPSASISTVCNVYRVELAEAEAALTDTPEDADLLLSASSLKDLIADTCN